MGSLLDRLKKQHQEKEQGGRGGLNPAVFPIFDLQIGQTATWRFLPGLDSKFDRYWTQRIMVPMTFRDPTDPTGKRQVFFHAPSLEMYGPEYDWKGPQQPYGCPLLRQTRALYKEAEALKKAQKTVESDQVKGVANKHWTSKSTQTYYQGFMLESDLKEQTIPENPIRILNAPKQLHDKIYNSVFKTPVEPWDQAPTGDFNLEQVKMALGNVDDLSDQEALELSKLFEGCNFKIIISEQGRDENTGKPYRNWDKSSTWLSNRHNMLTDAQLKAIEQYGFHDLRQFLPPQPSEEQYELMTEMMQLSIDRAFGRNDAAWDPEWEKMGCIPRRPRKEDGEDGDSSGTPATRSTSGGSSVSTTASRLLAARAGRATAVADTATNKSVETPATEATTETVSSEPAKTEVVQTNTGSSAQSKNVSDIISKVRNKMGQK